MFISQNTHEDQNNFVNVTSASPGSRQQTCCFFSLSSFERGSMIWGKIRVKKEGFEFWSWNRTMRARGHPLSVDPMFCSDRTCLHELCWLVRWVRVRLPPAGAWEAVFSSIFEELWVELWARWCSEKLLQAREKPQSVTLDGVLVWQISLNEWVVRHRWKWRRRIKGREVCEISR